MGSIKVTSTGATGLTASQIKNFCVELFISEINFVGHGSALDESIAIRIAFSEAFERLVVYENGLQNSNGCAVHTNLAAAIENAKFELIERDCFLTRFYLAYDYAKSEILEEREYDYVLGGEIKYYLLYNSDELAVAAGICCLADGFLIGLGTRKDLRKSLFKAKQELLRQISFYRTRKIVPSNYYDKFINKRKHNPQDHGMLAFDASYRLELEKHFQAKSDFLYRPPFGEYKICEFRSKLLADSPLFFVQVVNENAQNLFFGSTRKYLNLERMRYFDKNFNLIDLPHPLK